MRLTSICEEKEVREFAIRAAKAFAGCKEMNTFTVDDIEPGCLFAVRFGLGNDCVVVFKLDEFSEVVNFQQIIEKKNKGA